MSLLLSVGSQEVKDSRNIISSEKSPQTVLISEKPRVAVRNYPAKYATVKAEYDHRLIFNNCSKATSAQTDIEGIAAFKITSAAGYFGNEQEAKNNFLQKLNEIYYGVVKK